MGFRMSNESKGPEFSFGRIPYPVRMAIEGLSNEVRQAIVVLLGEKNRLRFSELQELLGLTKPNLAFHLNALMKSGLVSHLFDEFPSDEVHAYYCLSEIGEGLLHAIEESFAPPLPQQLVPERSHFPKLTRLHEERLLPSLVRLQRGVSVQRLRQTGYGYVLRPTVSERHFVSRKSRSMSYVAGGKERMIYA
jgi:DNA-binding HxlR family transcriptional regulator